jgi:hypothetical protein
MEPFNPTPNTAFSLFTASVLTHKEGYKSATICLSKENVSMITGKNSKQGILLTVTNTLPKL